MRKSDPARGQHILEVAAKLFARRHYHEVRMEDVAQAAGVAKGTIYRYFRDKEDLYLGLILTALERLYKEVVTGVERTEDPEEKLLVHVRCSVDFFVRHPYFFELVQRIETTGNQKKVASLNASRQKFFTLVGGFIQNLEVTGKYEVNRLDLATLALTGMIRQILRLHPQPFPADLPEWIRGQFLKGLLPKEGKVGNGQLRLNGRGRTGKKAALRKD